MKILICGINYFPELTGIGKYTGEMVEWLLAHGHCINVVTAPPYYPNWKVEKTYSSIKYKKERINANLTVFRCPLWVPRIPTAIKRIIHLASFALTSLPILLCHVTWQPDIVFVVEPPLFVAPGALLLSKLSGSKSWLHVQDFEVDAAFELGILRNDKLRRFIALSESALMRRFSIVSSISYKMIERLNLKKINDEKVKFFPNWVDTEKIYPLNRPSIYRKELSINDDVQVILYSGNMGEKQGLDILIDSAKRLREKENLLFVICGNGAARSRLQKASAGLNNIKWLELQPLEKLNDLLNLADIHLLPQRADAADLVMPSKLSGMLASGRPVIATSHERTEVASVVVGKGLVVPPENVDTLTDALVQLTDDVELRKRMGLEARKYAEEYLNIDSIMKLFESNMEKLLSE